MSLSYDDIAEILKIIDGSSCDELIVETGDLKLVVRRNSAGSSYSPSHDIGTPVAKTPSPPGPAGVPAPAETAPRQAPAKAPHQIEVTAPMVGTFYRAPSPDAPSFVEIGQHVRKGDALCVIEVMKLFTTIASEHDGRIVEIGADNAELVEYGRTLFVIEPA
ncbi:MAG: acetyl-CoA carboxylase biotin carboxyl carrier protein [Xanthobacteraceae bacterium]